MLPRNYTMPAREVAGNLFQGHGGVVGSWWRCGGGLPHGQLSGLGLRWCCCCGWLALLLLLLLLLVGGCHRQNCADGGGNVNRDRLTRW